MSKQDHHKRIIRRVKGLLKLAEDNSNHEESQAAFMQAQQMMVKYGVDPNELHIDDKMKSILTKNATSYKRLWWWERRLASIIAGNFRCTWFYRGKRFTGDVQMKRKIVFVGFEADVTLATDMYELAKSALQFYTKQFLQTEQQSENRSVRSKAKNDYMRGFIDGLENKFAEQIATENWGLVVVVPEAVKEKTKAITKGSKAISYYVPALKKHAHYEKGFTAGHRIDYTKQTLDE